MKILYRVTIYKTSRGWRWRLKSANGRIIGASTESYVERRKAIANLEAVTAWAPTKAQMKAPGNAHFVVFR